MTAPFFSIASRMLRGGRITKFKGTAASYAPHLGQATDQMALPGLPVHTSTEKSRLGSLARQLAASTMLAGIVVTGSLANDAHAGGCTLVAGPMNTYLCSGGIAGTDAIQGLAGGGAGLSVTTAAGFGIDTVASGAGASAFSLTNGVYDLTFTDGNTSTITGAAYGIHASNTGGGLLSITTTGDVTGKCDDGIYAYNSSNSTDLTIAAAAASGGVDGIYADNKGTGALSITATGDVTGTSGDGISANNSAAGTDLTIAATTVSGGGNGIDARNNGNGALSITATGDVTGTNGNGIYAINSATGTDLTIAAATVSGDFNGKFELVR